MHSRRSCQRSWCQQLLNCRSHCRQSRTGQRLAAAGCGLPGLQTCASPATHHRQHFRILYICATVVRGCQLAQPDMVALICHHVRADLQRRGDVGVHAAEVHDGCACIRLQCPRRQQQACMYRSACDWTQQGARQACGSHQQICLQFPPGCRQGRAACLKICQQSALFPQRNDSTPPPGAQAESAQRQPTWLSPEMPAVPSVWP